MRGLLILPRRSAWWSMVCLSALLGLAGCAEKDRIPSGIIARDKMEKILWDMIEADQYSDIYLAKDSARGKAKLETLRLYQQIFQLHQVSREDFRKSFQYYIGRPDLSRGLLDSALMQGNRERAASITAGGYKVPASKTTVPIPGSVPTLTIPNPAFPFHPFNRPGAGHPAMSPGHPVMSSGHGMPPGHAPPPVPGHAAARKDSTAGRTGRTSRPPDRLPPARILPLRILLSRIFMLQKILPDAKTGCRGRCGHS